MITPIRTLAAMDASSSLRLHNFLTSPELRGVIVRRIPPAATPDPALDTPSFSDPTP